MKTIDNRMTSYLHTYEAYRVEKGTKVQDTSGNAMVLSDESDVLVLTEKATKQFLKDRNDYAELLEMNWNVKAEQCNAESTKEMGKDLVKIMAVYRALEKGNYVPAKDERKLQEYDADLYQAAKIAQAMAQQKRKKEKSQWDEKEEEEHRKEMEELKQEADEALDDYCKGIKTFSDIQKTQVVETDSSNVDFSSLKVENLGNGVAGVQIDFYI